jgi:16S rRNA processing protein RimM
MLSADEAVSVSVEKLVKLGRISGVHGIKGWVKVFSYTEPRGNIVQFRTWLLEHNGSYRTVELEAGEQRGKNVVAKLSGVADREAARELIGADIAVERDTLPPCEPGEYYWADLEGLAVRTIDGETLGVVDHLLETGVHDVLVLKGDGSRMIPFVAGRVVREVDLEGGVVVVDWDAGYWDG